MPKRCGTRCHRNRALGFISFENGINSHLTEIFADALVQEEFGDLEALVGPERGDGDVSDQAVAIGGTVDFGESRQRAGGRADDESR